MTPAQISAEKSQQQTIDFDATMAQLLVLVTHHSLTRCENSLQPILEHLEALFGSADLDFFPLQRKVLIKMHKLWLMEQATRNRVH